MLNLFDCKNTDDYTAIYGLLVIVNAPMYIGVIT